MTEDRAEPEDAGLLRALGRAEPPSPAVLEAARETLWSAVAGEMLSPRAPGDAARTRAAGTGQSPEDTGRHQAEPGS